MKQEKTLYFIPILANAFDSKNKHAAIKKALDEIRNLGELPEYKKGFGQFEVFIAKGIDNIFTSLDTNSINVILDKFFRLLISGSVKISDEMKIELQQKINSNPDYSIRYKQLQDELLNTKYPELTIDLYQNDILLSSQPQPSYEEKVKFKNIEPGEYSIQLSNGRILWEGKIEKKDVIWSEAFPKKEYPMAAATEKSDQYSTRTFSIMDKELMIQLHPGLEAGVISITKNK